MQQPHKAILTAKWFNKSVDIPVQFNPTEFSLEKSVQLAEVPIPGLDSPLQQFVRGNAEKLTMDLFFDSTDEGMGAGATSVTERTDQIYSLVKIDPHTHAPPICTFHWHHNFPGAHVAEDLGKQRRSEFKCVIESVRQKFNLFSPEGVPLRATLSITAREYQTLEDQLPRLNLNSPDRTQSHVVQAGETLAGISAAHYQNAAPWRLIADENGLNDPRRLTPGTFLRVPPFPS